MTTESTSAIHWHRLGGEEAAARLGGNPRQKVFVTAKGLGLGAQYGSNALEVKRRPPFPKRCRPWSPSRSRWAQHAWSGKKR